MTGSKVEIKKFDNKHFELWKLWMTDLLVNTDLWSAIVNDRPTVEIAPATMSETYRNGNINYVWDLNSTVSDGELSSANRAALDKMDKKARGLICIFL